jgi:hypothetical protein
MKKIVLALGFLSMVGALAIGCGGPDNVGACENYNTTVNELKCLGDVKVDLDCSVYAETSCDVSEYFDCVSSHVKCVDDTTFDSAEYAKISECSEFATCN